MFENLPDASKQECCTTLLTGANLRFERIVSLGQSTPAGEWYDQEQHEWVMVVQGSAELLFEGEKEARSMKQGDFVEIPSHCRHRVEWTDPAIETIWLAIHF